MHGFSLVQGLLKKLEELAAGNGARRIKKVQLRLGPDSHHDAGEIRLAFDMLSKGGVADGAEVEIRLADEGDGDLWLEGFEML